MVINNTPPNCPLHHKPLSRGTRSVLVKDKPVLLPFHFCPEPGCFQEWDAIRSYYLRSEQSVDASSSAATTLAGAAKACSAASG